MRRIRVGHLALLGVMAVISLGHTSETRAQELVLNPVDIVGTVAFGDVLFTNAYITASSEEYFASISPYISPEVSETDYGLTVNVEEGGTREYTVIANILTGGNRFGLPPKTVDVVDLDPPQPTQLDLVQNDIGTIHGEVILPTGYEISGASIRMYFTDYSPNDWAGLRTMGSGDTAFDHPVAANENIRIGAYIYLTNGQSLYFAVPAFSVPKDGVHNVEFVVEAGADVGSVGGTVDIAGPVPIERYRARFSGPSGQLYKDYTPNAGTNAVEWLEEGLAASETIRYRQWFYAYFESLGLPITMYLDAAAFEPSDRYYLLKDQHTEINAQVNQAFVEGQINIGGNFPREDLESLRVSIASDGYGFSQGYADTTTMAYSAMGIDAGEWAIYDLYFVFRDSSNAYMETLNYSPTTLLYQRSALQADQTKQQDIDLAMGSVTLKFTVTDGQPLTNPRVQPKDSLSRCRYYNDQNELLYSWRPNVFTYSQVDVLAGELTFYGPDALCEDLRASATVGGTLTTFGLINVEVISGVDIVLDVGGPSLSVDVAPNSIFDIAQIEVTGIVSDDTGISGVTVNGISAVIVSTNNPDDANEMSFSTMVPLSTGANELVTIATDDSGKTSQDTRTVYRDGAAPILAFTPSNGERFVAPVTTVNVVGTVSDDNDVASLVINGSAVPLTHISAGNYSFRLDLPLNSCDGALPCDTLISAVASDSVGRVTTLAHTVSLVDNVQVEVCGDLDSDSDVDLADRSIFLSALRSRDGDSHYISAADYIADGVIGFGDYRAWYHCYRDYAAGL